MFQHDCLGFTRRSGLHRCFDPSAAWRLSPTALPPGDAADARHQPRRHQSPIAEPDQPRLGLRWILAAATGVGPGCEGIDTGTERALSADSAVIGLTSPLLRRQLVPPGIWRKPEKTGLAPGGRRFEPSGAKPLESAAPGGVAGDAGMSAGCI